MVGQITTRVLQFICCSCMIEILYINKRFLYISYIYMIYRFNSFIKKRMYNIVVEELELIIVMKIKF